MSNTLDTQRTQQIGYIEETIDGITGVTNGQPTYQFGLFTTSWGAYPRYMYEVFAGYRGAKFDPYEIRLAKALVTGSLSFIPINAQMIYYAIANNNPVSEVIDTSSNEIEFYDDGFPDVIMRTTGSWRDTLSAGDQIVIGGSSLNNGIYTIAELSGDYLIVLVDGDSLVNEVMSTGNLTITKAGVGIIEDHGSGNYTYGFAPVQNVKPQSFTLKYLTSNGTEKHAKDVTGCRVSRLSWGFDFISQDAILASTASYLGTDMQDTVDTDDTPPVYVDGELLDKQQFYAFDDNMEVEWDSGAGTPVDLIPYLMDFNIILSMAHRHRFIEGQINPRWVGVGNRTLAVAFKMLRADATQVFDDYVDQVGNNFKDVKFKIFKNETDYLEFTFNDIVLTKCEMNHALDSQGQEPYYDVEGVVTSLSMKSRETTPKGFYGL